MKRIVLLLTVLVLAGCSQSPAQMEGATAACVPYGGVKYYSNEPDASKFNVTCTDGTNIRGVVKR